MPDVSFHNTILIAKDSFLPRLPIKAYYCNSSVIIMAQPSQELFSTSTIKHKSIFTIEELGKTIYQDLDDKEAAVYRLAMDSILRAPESIKQAFKTLAESDPNYAMLNVLYLRAQKFDERHPDIRQSLGIPRPTENSRTQG